jgi:hypothetical protein
LLLNEAHQRVPLPEADGIVENGEILPDGITEAQVRVREINSEVRMQAEAFEELVNGRRSGPAVTQRPSRPALHADDSV